MPVFYVGARDFKSALPCIVYIAFRVKPFMHICRDSVPGTLALDWSLWHYCLQKFFFTLQGYMVETW